MSVEMASDLIARFQQIPPIIGEPCHETLDNAERILQRNFVSKPTTLAGGLHGHLGMGI